MTCHGTCLRSNTARPECEGCSIPLNWDKQSYEQHDITEKLYTYNRERPLNTPPVRRQERRIR